MEAQKKKLCSWGDKGRTNQIWKTAHHDPYPAFRRNRFPMSPLEMNPEDAKSLGIALRDIVELNKDHGAAFAVAYWSRT